MVKSIGKVSQIIGPVVDVEFSGEKNPLPNIYDALEIENSDGTKLILEVQSHIGEETRLCECVDVESFASSIWITSYLDTIEPLAINSLPL